MLLMMSLFHLGAPLFMISFASTGRLVSDVYCAPLWWCESAVPGISICDETVFSSWSGCLEKLQDKSANPILFLYIGT